MQRPETLSEQYEREVKNLLKTVDYYNGAYRDQQFNEDKSIDICSNVKFTMNEYLDIFTLIHNAQSRKFEIIKFMVDMLVKWDESGYYLSNPEHKLQDMSQYGDLIKNYEEEQELLTKINSTINYIENILKSDKEKL